MKKLKTGGKGSQVVYTDDELNSIERGLAEGKGLAKVVKALKHDYFTFVCWMNADDERVERFARARAIGATTLVDEALDIADDETSDALIGNVAVNRSKTKIDTRLKIASFYNRKQFGNHVEHEHVGKIPVAMSDDDKFV